MRSIGANSARCASARAHVQLVARGGEIDVEQVLPGPARDRPRLELGQVDAAQREHAQRLEERARLVRQREDDRRLVGHARSAAARRPMTRKRVMLSSKSWIDEASDVEAEHLAGARRGDRRGVLQPGVGDHLGAAGRVVGRDDLDAGQRPQEPLALRQRLRMRVHAAQRRRASRPAARAGGGRPAARPRRRSAARARAAGRSCGGCCRRSSSRSAGRRRPAVPRLDGVEHLLEAPARAPARASGVDPPGAPLAEGAGLALIRNLHRQVAPITYVRPQPRSQIDNLYSDYKQITICRLSDASVGSVTPRCAWYLPFLSL